MSSAGSATLQNSSTSSGTSTQCDVLLLAVGPTRLELDRETQKFHKYFVTMFGQIFRNEEDCGARWRIFPQYKVTGSDAGPLIFGVALKALLPTTHGVLARMMGRLNFSDWNSGCEIDTRKAKIELTRIIAVTRSESGKALGLCNSRGLVGKSPWVAKIPQP